ncbi:hypothetical protein K435DRAFT_880686 [Dendrothele bispora CBS 962.96]|uniref:Uncharacterized protein n=1 Tax=Dendrothele bispora (strain CBS 962.96) TaxID=1314807 RepID=A0A4S8KJ58_DENBC|nr:hypothetical protein K435DRAFT_880686 [Dendrothele bispora CBS 962.96]
MSPELAAKLPSTTNAEEALHSKLYQVAGKNNDLITGFDGLLRLERLQHSQWEAASMGQPIRYGKSKRKVFEQDNALDQPVSKQTRRQKALAKTRVDKESLYEGRAPDTKTHFLAEKRKQKRSQHHSHVHHSQPPIHAPSKQHIPSTHFIPSTPSKIHPHPASAALLCLSPEKEKLSVHYQDPSSQKSQVQIIGPGPPIKLKATRSLPSYPWSKNSCWLDASLESLYCALSYYGHWEEFLQFAAPAVQTGSPIAIVELFKSLNARREWPISSFPRMEDGRPCEELRVIRDRLKTSLFQMGALGSGLGADEYHDTLHWFSFLVNPSSPHTTNETCQRFFSVWEQTIWNCSGGTSDHCLVERVQICPAGMEHPQPAHYQQYDGSIKKWLQEHTQLKKAVSAANTRSCWRHHTGLETNNQSVFCDRAAKEIVFWSSIPVVLILKPAVTENHAPDWDFPRKIHPLSAKDGEEKDLVYEMRARIFYNGIHFVCYTIIPTGQGAALFFYDSNGSQSSGYSVHQKGSVDKLISGPTPLCPSGYHTHAVPRTFWI